MISVPVAVEKNIRNVAGKKCNQLDLKKTLCTIWKGHFKFFNTFLLFILIFTKEELFRGYDTYDV